MRACAIVLLLALSVFSFGTAQDVHSYESYVALIGELTSSLDQAIYLSKSGIIAYDTRDEQSMAQGIVNLLNGASHPQYDVTNPYVVVDGAGVLPLGVYLTDSVWDPMLDRIPDTQRYLFDNAYHHYGEFIRLASDAAVKALDSSSSGQSAEDEFRLCYALLLAARGGFDDSLLFDGIDLWTDAFPEREVWVRSGESIQAAIDRLPDGGWIYLEPGVYDENLIITKNLHLKGVSVDGVGQAILQGERSGIGVNIVSGNSLRVEIENLVIRGKARGVYVGGGSSATLVNLHVEDSSVGLYVNGNARAIMDDCTFLRDDTAVSAWSRSYVELRESSISECGDLDPAVLLAEDAHLLLDQCNISDYRGIGIKTVSTAQLELMGCTIGQSELAAIVVLDLGDCASIPETILNMMLGTTPGYVSGAGNIVESSLCPASLQGQLD